MTLREAIQKDGVELYQWVMDEETRANAPNPETFTLETHLSWLRTKINSNRSLILIGEINGFSVGQIRFELQDSRTIALSIVVNPTSRGKGVGKELIREGINWLRDINPMKLENGDLNLTADLKTSNLASKRIFESNGFRKRNGLYKINDVDYYHFHKIVPI